MANKVGRPKLFNSAEELETKIEIYFAEQDKKYKPNLPVYTMGGLAYALGIDRQTLLNYEKDQEFFGTIKRARAKVEYMVEERLMAGNNATGHIFNLKNNFGWVDKQEKDLKSSDGSMKPTVIEFVAKNDESED